MFSFFKKKVFGSDKSLSVPVIDDNEINRISGAIDDNVILSGAVDSYSDSEDAKLARPDAPGVMKTQDDIKLAKFY
jgi:hypothetical protein